MNTVSAPQVRVFIPKNGPEDHKIHLEALAKGIPGAKIHRLEDGYAECDVAVIFGIGKRVISASHARGAIVYEHRYRARKPIIIVERGFINRASYYGVALDGLNGLGYFGEGGNPPDRWEALGVEMKPYRTGKYTLVCGQVPWDASVQHTDHVQWCNDTVEKIKSLSNRPVVFRAHPDVPDYDYGVESSTRTFEEDLSEAHSVVTFSSTSSALAVLEGIPIFAMDRGSIAYGVANTEITADLIENPIRHPREQWAYDLAYSQWTADEMAKGLPWRRLWGAKKSPRKALQSN